MTAAGLGQLTQPQQAHVLSRWVLGRVVASRMTGLRSRGAGALAEDLEASLVQVTAAPGPIAGRDLDEHLADTWKRVSERVHVAHPTACKDEAAVLAAMQQDALDWGQSRLDPCLEVWGYVERLAHRLCPAPVRDIRLSLGWSARTKGGPDVLAQTSLRSDDSAEVALVLHSQVNLVSLLSLPYVLAHEVLVHGVAAEPLVLESDAFAEGWVDTVIEDAVSRAIQGGEVPGVFPPLDQIALKAIRARYDGRYEGDGLPGQTGGGRGTGAYAARRVRISLGRVAPPDQDLTALWQEMTFSCSAAAVPFQVREAACMNLCALHESPPHQRSAAVELAVDATVARWLDVRDPSQLLESLASVPGAP